MCVCSNAEVKSTGLYQTKQLDICIECFAQRKCSSNNSVSKKNPTKKTINKTMLRGKHVLLTANIFDTSYCKKEIA